MVDTLVVGNGHNIQSTRQTVVDATFAKRNNLKIGNIVRFQADDLGEQLLVTSELNTKTSDFNRQQIAQIKNLDDPDDIYNQLYSTYT
jgi:putative ABC transport system permease protein